VRRWALKIVLFVVCVAAFLGYLAYEHNEGERMRRESNAKAQALKDEIDARFSKGAPQRDVVGFLQPKLSGGGVWGGLASYSKGDIFVLFVGREPSGVWYCGPYAVGVAAKFVEERLIETELTGRADDCL
jgi:hypothetical protein